jgi:hypothetical protein
MPADNSGNVATPLFGAVDPTLGGLAAGFSAPKGQGWIRGTGAFTGGGLGALGGGALGAGAGYGLGRLTTDRDTARQLARLGALLGAMGGGAYGAAKGRQASMHGVERAQKEGAFYAAGRTSALQKLGFARA